MFKKGYTPWNKGLTKETDDRVAKNAESIKQSADKMNKTRIKTCLERYGVDNVSKVDSVREKIHLSHSSDEWKEQVRNIKLQRYGSETYNNMEKNRYTKLERYGNANYNNRQKAKETCLVRYGVDHHNKYKLISKKISATRIKCNSQRKAFETILEKYGSLSEYYKLVQAKIYKTRKLNGTFSNYKSKAEIELEHKLVSVFGEDNIIYQYRSEEYPFKCDFYVSSLDLYIEFNGMWTHGPHPYNHADPNDVALRMELINKKTDWDNCFVYTWTDLDVRKYNIGIFNDLNLWLIYPNGKGEDIVYTHSKGCGESYSRIICSDIMQMF